MWSTSLFIALHTIAIDEQTAFDLVSAVDLSLKYVVYSESSLGQLEIQTLSERFETFDDHRRRIRETALKNRKSIVCNRESFWSSHARFAQLR